MLSVARIRLLCIATFTGLTLGGCQAVLGLDDYGVSAAPSAEPFVCRSHADCVQPNATCTSKGRCEPLQNEDCTPLAGAESDPHALLIGTLFATSGPDSAVELARQRAVQLAVEELDQAGGIPAKDSDVRRNLVLLACDAASNRDRASEHLVSLGARAILGLSDSESLLQTLRMQLLAANVLTLSTAVASDSINSLLDADLAWLLAPTVEQRAPMLDAVLTALEQHLQAERSAPLKLALLVRYDTAGRAALASLRTHELDGLSLGMPDQSAGRVRVDRFPDAAADQQALLAAYRGFAPDIVVLVGALEVLTGFMAPLERSYENDAVALRPHYLLTEEVKGPTLIALASELPSLVERVHGVGGATPELSRNAYAGFQQRYAARFGDDELSAAPRVAAAYDAVYALGYATAEIELGHEVSGRLAQALHVLSAPELAAEFAYDVGPEALGIGLQRALSAQPLALIGASDELHWDGYGSLRTGVLEAWCIAADSGGPGYGNAALQYDVAARSFSARLGSCDAWLGMPGAQMPTTPTADLSCQSRSPGCDSSAQCVSDADCVSGSVCCASSQEAHCVPDSMCSGGHLACKSAQECPAGQLCCLYGEGASSACAAACGVADGSVRLCASDADCADDPAATTCNPSTLLPVVSACGPAAAL